MSGHLPAYPVPLNTWEKYEGHSPYDGLTKRELFAAMAMQGLQGSSLAEKASSEMIAGWAVHAADALLAELAKDGAR